MESLYNVTLMRYLCSFADSTNVGTFYQAFIMKMLTYRSRPLQSYGVETFESYYSGEFFFAMSNHLQLNICTSFYFQCYKNIDEMPLMFFIFSQVSRTVPTPVSETFESQSSVYIFYLAVDFTLSLFAGTTRISSYHNQLLFTRPLRRLEDRRQRRRITSLKLKTNFLQ